MKLKKVVNKTKKGVNWITRHWVLVVIGAALAYVGVILVHALRDKGIGPDGKPYYKDFETPDEKEDKNDK